MTVLMIILSLFALLFIVASLMSKHMHIEKTVVINKPVSDVFNYVKLIKNQDHYSVWNMADPNMKRSYTGTDGTVGFVYAWDSTTNKNVGAGAQETKSIVENKSIDMELRFERPMKNVAKASFAFESLAGNQTKVTWVFSGPMKVPMNLMKSMLQKMLGNDLEKGLQNLKHVLEK